MFGKFDKCHIRAFREFNNFGDFVELGKALSFYLQKHIFSIYNDQVLPCQTLQTHQSHQIHQNCKICTKTCKKGLKNYYVKPNLT
jgi:predicted lipoprotein